MTIEAFDASAVVSVLASGLFLDLLLGVFNGWLVVRKESGKGHMSPWPMSMAFFAGMGVLMVQGASRKWELTWGFVLHLAIWLAVPFALGALGIWLNMYAIPEWMLKVAKRKGRC